MIGHALPVYSGYSSQYGHGLGNVLGGVVRAAVPYVTEFAKKAGVKLLSKGLDYLQEKITKKRTTTPQNPPAKKQKVTSGVKPKTNKSKAPKTKSVSRNKGRRRADIFGI